MQGQKRHFFLAVVLGIVTSTVAAYAESGHEKAREMWMRGYLKIEEANKAEAEGSRALALELYKEALNVFEEVSQEFSEWNPSLISFRVNYTQERIRRLEAILDVEVEGLAKPDLVRRVKQLRKEYDEAAAKAEKLENELASSQEKLTIMQEERAELADHADIILQAREKVESLERENEELKLELASLGDKQQQKSVAVKSQLQAVQERLKQKESALKELQEQFKEATQRYATAEKELNEQLQAQLKSSKAKEQEATALNEELERNLKQRTAQLDEVKTQLQNTQERSQELLTKAENAEGKVDDLQQRIAELEAVTTKEKSEQQKETLAALQAKQELAEKVASLTETAATRNEELQQTKNELDELKQKLTANQLAHDKEVTGLKDALNAALTDLKNATNDLRIVQEQSTDQQKTIAKLEKDLADTDTKRVAVVNEMQEKIAALNNKNNELQQLAATAQKELANATAAVKEKDEAFTAVKNDFAAVTDRAKTLSEKHANTVADLKEKVAVVEKLEKERQQNATTIQNLQQQFTDTKTVLAEVQGKAENLNETLLATRTELQQEQEKAKELQRLVDLAQARNVDELEEQLQTAKLELKRSHSQVAELQQELLAKQEAEKRLIAEKQQRLQEEKQIAQQKYEREKTLHSHLKAGAEAEKSKNLEHAIVNYKKVLEIEPNHKDALTQVGTLLAQQPGQDLQAVQYLQKAFHQDPDNTAILKPLGFALLRLEKAYMAIGVLSRATGLNPDDAELHRYLGVAFRTVGWSDAAEDELRQSFRLNDGNPETAYNLAVLLATLDEPRLEDAKDWYEKAKKLGAQVDPGLEQFFKSM